MTSREQIVDSFIDQRESAVYVGGEWVPSAGHDRIDVMNPATEHTVGSVPAGTAADVDAAVRAARSAFASWSALSGVQRAEWLDRLADTLEASAEEVGRIVSSEMGMPVRLAANWQVGLPVQNLRAFAALAREFGADEERMGNSLIVREAIGVVGCIAPWNYPLHQMILKVAPALAAGCTVVCKPSEVAPLSTFRFVHLLDEIGFPAGVLNLVSGFGDPVGEAIAAHPDVDMVSFTGSTRAGTRVAEVASPTVKRVSLELGGKSANVILDDADLAAAVVDGVAKCFQNSGQTCSALTRMLVPRELQEQVVELAVRAVDSYRVGEPSEESTDLGPLVSATQFDRVEGYIRAGIEGGARLVTGGAGKARATGYFVKPTVFADVTPDMVVARDEIFGPVLVIMPYDTEEDAVRVANDTQYGLAGGVWSGDASRALRVARRIRAGQVEVNGGAYNPMAPFGGYKMSGVGREAGRYGLEEFLEVKSIQL